jgi:hypothetical protein
MARFESTITQELYMSAKQTGSMKDQLGDLLVKQQAKIEASNITSTDDELDEDIDVSFGAQLQGVSLDDEEEDEDESISETSEEPDEDEDDAGDVQDESAEEVHVHEHEIEVEVEDEQATEDFETVPFAGEISQELTLVVALGNATDIGEHNFQNPFSKKGGVVRELISRIAAKMMDLASRNVLLLTDNLSAAATSIYKILEADAVNHIQQMFNGEDPSGQLQVSCTTGEIEAVADGYPKLSINTSIAVNMPALTDAKADVAIRNLFVYLNKLDEQLEGVNLRIIIGFTTAQIIDPVASTTFSVLRDMASDDTQGIQLCLAETSTALAVNGFSEEEIADLFEKFDVVFVKA